MKRFRVPGHGIRFGVVPGGLWIHNKGWAKLCSPFGTGASTPEPQTVVSGEIATGRVRWLD